MPYSSVKDVPEYVPKKRRRQWLHVFNSAYRAAIKDGKDAKEAEESAFAQANAVAGPNAKEAAVTVKAIGTKATGFVRAVDGPFRCGHCSFMEKKAGGEGFCTEPDVAKDPELKDEPRTAKDLVIVYGGDCCNEYEPVKKEKAMKSATARRFSKFIPFVKVDAARREVWGIVTAEQPDKDDEVCDYAGSKPYYQAVIEEMGKATDGENFFPLREMHQLSAAGKCIGFDFRDNDREIFMGFKVVDDAAWKKVDESVYTGFSHGGSIVDMKPDPVFDGCKRYIADPAEVSLVDNPCLAAAHFAYVKTDGTVELRKFKRTVTPAAERNRLGDLESEIALLKAKLFGKAKTKVVDGEELPASAFLIVADAEKPASWELPVKFADAEKTKSHIKNALARFSQLRGVPAKDRDATYKRLVSIAVQNGISVDDEKTKLASCFAWLRKRVRTHVNQLARTVRGGNVGFAVATVDDEVGKLQKGLYEVSRLAQIVQELGFMVYNVASEAEWEADDSPLPGLLADNVDKILDTLLQMVEEESEELRADLASRVG